MTCDECLKDVDAVGSLMITDMGGTISMIKDLLKDYMFCKKFPADQVPKCQTMVEKYFPESCKALGQTIHMFDQKICSDLFHVC